MSSDTQVVWGIHGGSSGEAFELFTEENVVAIGFATQNLSGVPDDPSAFRAIVEGLYPDRTPNSIANTAGQLRRFRYEVAIGDIVVYPAKQDRTYRIGRVTGDYSFNADAISYPHRRAVSWLKSVDRDAFSQSTRYELGSAMTLFRVKSHAGEFLAALAGDQPSSSVTASTDDPAEAIGTTAAAVQVAQSTEDFVLERIRANYHSFAFEEFVADLFTAMGYKAEPTRKTGDHGVDVIAGRGPLGLDPPILKIQVKAGTTPTGDPELMKLNGSVAQHEGEAGVLISLGGFTSNALKQAQTLKSMRLVGPSEFVSLVLDHYDLLPEQTRQNIPLRQVWAPDVGDA